MRGRGRSRTQMIDIAEFTGKMKANKYWAEAGELVVKELMYLDALQVRVG